MCGGNEEVEMGDDKAIKIAPLLRFIKFSFTEHESVVLTGLASPHTIIR